MESLTGDPQTKSLPAIPGQPLIVGKLGFSGISVGWRLSGAVVSGTQLPDRLNQGAQVLRVHVRVDPVAQVEYMA